MTHILMYVGIKKCDFESNAELSGYMDFPHDMALFKSSTLNMILFKHLNQLFLKCDLYKTLFKSVIFKVYWLLQ